MNGIKCGFLDRAHSLLCSNDVYDLTAALIQDRVNVCLMGDLQLVLGSHPQRVDLSRPTCFSSSKTIITCRYICIENI